MDLEEERLKEKAATLTLCQKVILYSLRVFMLILSLTLIGGALYCIILATNFSQVNDLKVAWWRICQLQSENVERFLLKQDKLGQTGFLGLIYEYLPSIVITAGNFVVPMLSDQIALAERYSPSTTVILALLRFALALMWNQSKVCCALSRPGAV